MRHTQKIREILDLLINEDTDLAEKLLHDVIVEKARNIHASLMEDDMADDIDGMKEQINAEEYFGESDEMDDGSDVSAEVAAAAKEIKALSDKLASDLEANVESAEVISNAASGMAGDEEINIDDEEDDEDDFDELDEDSDLFFEEDDEDDFDDLEEGVMDLLKDVKAQAKKASLAGAGGSFKENNVSPMAQKSFQKRQGGSGITVKDKAHRGFNMEKAPKSGRLLSGEVRNARKSTFSGNEKVTKGGDPKAILNKRDSKEIGASPIAGKKPR